MQSCMAGATEVTHTKTQQQWNPEGSGALARPGAAPSPGKAVGSLPAATAHFTCAGAGRDEPGSFRKVQRPTFPPKKKWEKEKAADI